MDNLLRGMLVPHTSRYFDPDGGDPVFRPVFRGLVALGDEVARLRPDAIVIATAHWVTTFHHYVAGSSRLAGVLAATGAPDLIRNLPYDYPDDPGLAGALVAAGRAEQVPVVLTEETGAPSCWPAPPDRELDDHMMELLSAGEVAQFETSLGQLARDAHLEAGGRHLALLLGALGSAYRGRVLGYGASSDTGNAVVTLSAA